MFHRTGTALVILSAAIGPALHAATLDVTSGTLTCLATAGVNNALTISASGASYVFNDTGETITLSANAISAGWTGSGTNTVTGPTSSVTADFQVNLLDGADTLTLSTPITVSGNVILFSGGSITQGASALITAGGLAISDNDGIGTSSAVLLTAVARIEAKSVNGDIFIFNTAPVLDVGGVTGALSGIQITGSGNIHLFNTGTIRILTDGDTISGMATSTSRHSAISTPATSRCSRQSRGTERAARSGLWRARTSTPARTARWFRTESSASSPIATSTSAATRRCGRSETGRWTCTRRARSPRTDRSAAASSFP